MLHQQVTKGTKPQSAPGTLWLGLPSSVCSLMCINVHVRCLKTFYSAVND